MTCTQCHQEAVTRVTWQTPKGSHSLALCPRCLADWWRMYKHTEAGLSARFLDLEPQPQEQRP